VEIRSAEKSFDRRPRRAVGKRPEPQGSTPRPVAGGDDSGASHREYSLKSYLHRERRDKKADEEDILFTFECKPCNKRMALWQDGTEWEGYQARCEKCSVPVDETDRRRGSVITTIYTCGNCGHNHKSTWKLGATDKAEIDPYFKLDRRRFCFDAATGGRFLARKAHIEHIGDLSRKHAGVEGEVPDPVSKRKKPTARPAPVVEAPSSTEPAPVQKPSRRGKQRAPRLRVVLHPHLRMIIPPRETKKSPPKAKKTT
jgi:hypothetical protein